MYPWFSPDVSPLAIQGPKADDLMAEIVGEEIRDLKYFWYIRANIAGMDLIIARSGWSGQVGYEIILRIPKRVWRCGMRSGRLGKSTIFVPVAPI